MELTSLIGLVMPPIIDVVNKRVADTKIRFLIAMAICTLAGALTHIQEIQSGSWEILIGKIGIIFTEAQVIYKLYWEKSDLRSKMIEK